MIMNSPFDGISRSQANKLFDLLETHIYKFNKNQVDRLVDLGLIDEEEVKKCATVKIKSAYYKLTEK